MGQSGHIFCHHKSGVVPSNRNFEDELHVAQSASCRYLSTVYYWSSERDGVWICVSRSVLHFFWMYINKSSVLIREKQRSAPGPQGTRLQLTDHAWSVTMGDTYTKVPATAREPRRPSCGVTYGHIVSLLRDWLQIHPPRWSLIERFLSKCGPGIKYNLLSSKKLYYGPFPDVNRINITTRIIIF